jgi:hypothetical protein
LHREDADRVTVGDAAVAIRDAGANALLATEIRANPSRCTGVDYRRCRVAAEKLYALALQDFRNRVYDSHRLLLRPGLERHRQCADYSNESRLGDDGKQRSPATFPSPIECCRQLPRRNSQRAPEQGDAMNLGIPTMAHLTLSLPRTGSEDPAAGAFL